MTCQLKATQQDDRGTKEKRKHDAYGDRGRADVRGELALKRPAALELVARGDDPKPQGDGSAADPAMNLVILVVKRVLVLVVHLPPELRLRGVDQQHGLLVRQRLATGRVPIRRPRHVPLDPVRHRHVVEPRRVELEGEPGLRDVQRRPAVRVLKDGVAVEPGVASQHHQPIS
jgi:hypothetical protein